MPYQLLSDNKSMSFTPLMLALQRCCRHADVSHKKLFLKLLEDSDINATIIIMDNNKYIEESVLTMAVKQKYAWAVNAIIKSDAFDINKVYRMWIREGQIDIIHERTILTIAFGDRITTFLNCSPLVLTLLRRAGKHFQPCKQLKVWKSPITKLDRNEITVINRIERLILGNATWEILRTPPEEDPTWSWLQNKDTQNFVDIFNDELKKLHTSLSCERKILFDKQRKDWDNLVKYNANVLEVARQTIWTDYPLATDAAKHKAENWIAMNNPEKAEKTLEKSHNKMNKQGDIE